MLQINNLLARVTRHQTQIQTAVERVIKSGWFVLGPEVKRFEQSFATFLGSNHCISVGNGTDAIELALKALGVQTGEKVATVANAGMYTTTALLAIGAEPYFMDVDLDTKVVTLKEVVRAVEMGVKAVVVTHLYGLAIPDINAIANYCKQTHIPLLEDCAQAHGAKINGKRVGTFGNAASFSFYPTKNLGALGDGGAVITNDLAIAKKVELLRQYGWTAKYQVEIPNSRNSRLDEMQAAVLSEFLPFLDQANAQRREIATHYSALINHPNVITPQIEENNSVAHLYVIRSVQRDQLRDHLRQLEIGSDIHYPIPDYRQPVFGEQFAHVHLQTTEQLANEILTLPCYPEMSIQEVEQVISAVNGWCV
jgi:dTDP-3-amino-2,3,6-trideoxy-4-keto-D-glucose/dTDP-3-amino-3,4,6-trideoxy-alpha-D-glucose/dTDP-2,6-dideoxy-D-kanosamine transaminase